MTTNDKTGRGDRSPIPDAIRISYFDERGEVYYTEWQLMPPGEPSTALPDATVPTPKEPVVILCRAA